MKNVIVGTAGHIDHGKTCLIKALTDIDTDRLKEEKERGITIELGFADLPNDIGMDIGIIDVPGHEKFVKHMLAGIGGIDIVLLIVAADEGFMPQTKEHFEILKMLRIKRGIIVVTKIDMVDKEWIEVVREDIKDNVKDTFLEGAPVMEVSSQTGVGIDELRKLILEMSLECDSRREDKSLLRLPIDRVFTIDGFGTVITGTLMEGTLEIGDEIMIYPSEKRAKVRNIQVHSKSVKEARAGQRTAINLAKVKKEEIDRGNVAAYPGLLENTRMLDVRIDMFKDTKRVLKSGTRLHFYYGSAEALCKAVLLNKENLSKGESGYAQLRFEEEIAVKRGDHFILRFYSPLETIGGGKILNETAKKKKFDDIAIESLRVRDEGDDKEILEQIFFEESYALSDIQEVIKKFGGTEAETEGIIENLYKEKRIAKISENLVLHEKYLTHVKDRVHILWEKYHEENPVSIGMIKEEFRVKLSNILYTENMKNIELVIEYLLREGYIKEQEGRISLKEFIVVYTQEQLQMAERIEKLYEEAGLEPPRLEDVLLQFDNKKIAEQMIMAMSTENKLTRLNYLYYIHTGVLNVAIDKLIKRLEQEGRITLAEYRDLIGTSRKYAVMILNYADEKGITRMTGDFRELNR